MTSKRQTGSLLIGLTFAVLIMLLGGSVYYNFELSKKNSELEKSQSKDTLTVNTDMVSYPSENINPNSQSLKNYSDPKGFSFDYPEEIFLTGESLLPISPLYPKPPASIGLEGASMSMSITTAVAPAKLTIRNSLGEGPKLSYDGRVINNNNDNFKLFTIDGVDAIRADGVPGPNGSTATDVIFFKDGLIYEIAYYPVNSNNLKVFEQVLLTFKFTK